MTPPPTDRARALVDKWIGECDFFAEVPRADEKRLIDAIAQLLRDTEAEVRERCAKVVDDKNPSLMAADAILSDFGEGLAKRLTRIAAAIREAKP